MKRFWTPAESKSGKGSGRNFLHCLLSLQNVLRIFLHCLHTLQNMLRISLVSHMHHICMLPETQWVLLFRNRPNHLFTSSSLLSWVGRVLGLIFNSHPVEKISFAITGDPLIILLSLSQLPASLKLSETTWKVDSAGHLISFGAIQKVRLTKRWIWCRSRPWGWCDLGVY